MLSGRKVVAISGTDSIGERDGYQHDQETIQSKAYASSAVTLLKNGVFSAAARCLGRGQCDISVGTVID
jgi:hypothetical protein